MLLRMQRGAGTANTEEEAMAPIERFQCSAEIAAPALHIYQVPTGAEGYQQ